MGPSIQLRSLVRFGPVQIRESRRDTRQRGVVTAHEVLPTREARWSLSAQDYTGLSTLMPPDLRRSLSEC